MADALKKAAVWLGLVSDNNYAQSEYGADDVTQQVGSWTVRVKASKVSASSTM